MAGPNRLLAAAALVLAFAGAAQAATDIRINPIPPQVQPQWTPVPNAPGVDWAPNIPTDVFRHGTSYYFYWDHFIFQGSSPSGPWKLVHELPGWFSQIDPSYLKTMNTGPPAGSAGPVPAPAPAPAPGAPGPAPAAPEALPPAAPLPPPPGEAPSPPPGTPNLPKVM
ncbi:MAG: hypothetical protein ACLP7A_05845 [Desulfobaccales bacterium]